MLHTPHPPHVLTTLQVGCVACKQPFLVAETDPRPRRGHGQWRIVSPAQSYVSLRYTEDSTSQPTQPPPRPHTQREIPPPSPPNFGDNALNCPRCGADNRNWLHVLHGHADDSSFPPSWWYKFRPAVWGVAIAVALTVAAAWRQFDADNVGRSLVFLLAVFLAGFLPCYFVPKAWYALRDYRNGRGYVPTRIPLSPPLRHILIIGAIFIFILPGFLYIATPLGFDFAGELISPTSPPTLPQRINTVIEEIGPVLEKTPNDKEVRAEDAVGTLERLLDLTPAEGATLYQRSQTALAAARDTAKQRPDSETTTQIAAEIGTLESFINATKPPRVDTGFLKTWFKYTMTSHVLAAVLAMMAVSQYVGRINRQLPRPIFHSVSGMVRVVQWEVQRALEVDGDMRHVQWMDVERNEVGGINMIGLHRASPEFEDGRPAGTTIRAQRYEIMSDAWGRLVYAEVRDIRAPISAVSPEHAVAAEHWPTIPQAQNNVQVWGPSDIMRS